MTIIDNLDVLQEEVGRQFLLPIVKVDSTGRVVTDCYNNSADVFDNGNSEATVTGLLAPLESSLIYSTASNTVFSYNVETMPNNEENNDGCDGTDLVMHCYVDEKQDADGEGDVDDGAGNDNGRQMATLTPTYLSGRELHIKTSRAGADGNQRGIESEKSYNFIQLIQDGTHVLGRMQMVNDEHDMSVHEVEVVECTANEVEVSSLEGGDISAVATSITQLQGNQWSAVTSKCLESSSEGTTLLVAIPSTSSTLNSYIVLPSAIMGSQQILMPASPKHTTSAARQDLYQPVEGPTKILPGNSQFKSIEPGISMIQIQFSVIVFLHKL